jgi:hypothetical protein
MVSVALVCQLLALGCFVAVMFGVAARVNLMGAGLALWVLSGLVRGVALLSLGPGG